MLKIRGPEPRSDRKATLTSNSPVTSSFSRKLWLIHISNYHTEKINLNTDYCKECIYSSSYLPHRINLQH